MSGPLRESLTLPTKLPASLSVSMAETGLEVTCRCWWHMVFIALKDVCKLDTDIVLICLVGKLLQGHLLRTVSKAVGRAWWTWIWTTRSYTFHCFHGVHCNGALWGLLTCDVWGAILFLPRFIPLSSCAPWWSG